MKTFQENVKALINKLNESFSFNFYLEEMANFGRPFTVLREKAQFYSIPWKGYPEEEDYLRELIEYICAQ